MNDNERRHGAPFEKRLSSLPISRPPPKDVEKSDSDAICNATGNSVGENVMESSVDLDSEEKSGIRARKLGPAPRDGAAPRVFVADDDEDLRQLVAASLRRDGYDVVELTDGRETLEAISNAFQFPLELPDLIVMDLLMPHCSGLGILLALRRARWTTPVVMMTGFRHSSVTDRAKELGAAAILRKPFRPSELREVVAGVMGDRARSAAVCP